MRVGQDDSHSMVLLPELLAKETLAAVFLLHVCHSFCPDLHVLIFYHHYEEEGVHLLEDGSRLFVVDVRLTGGDEAVDEGVDEVHFLRFKGMISCKIVWKMEENDVNSYYW
jgi:hypothetical protein